MIHPIVQHRAKIPADDGGSITFQWHWPRGTFAKYMSAYDMAVFILPHMPFILPLLAGHTRVMQEFEAMMIVLLTSPKEAIDRLLPWIRSATRTQDDDIIELQLGAHFNEDAPKYFHFA